MNVGGNFSQDPRAIRGYAIIAKGIHLSRLNQMHSQFLHNRRIKFTRSSSMAKTGTALVQTTDTAKRFASTSMQ